MTKNMDKATQIAVESEAFRRLVKHFRDNPEVQNIELMAVSNFCRNCLSKWYAAAAEERGVEVNYEEAREIIYGMPYAVWKDKHQTEATEEQKAAFIAKHGKK